MPLAQQLKWSLLFAVLLSAFVCLDAHAAGKPLRIYILVGQSNMEGHANIKTLSYMNEDPKTRPLYNMMIDKDGKPVVADHVWVSNITGHPEEDGVYNGKLTAGLGARGDAAKLGDNIGPELGFGFTLQQAYDGPILLIKCAWGGKSLHTDFRPPSAGPYVFNKGQIEQLKKKGEDLKQAQADKDKKTGHYYRLMAEHVKKVLADPGKYCPAYDPKAGYEVAGFVWFQGWNDAVAGGVYPNRDQPGGYDLYTKLLETFIKDVRKDFKAPDMPFVIGVMGVGGPTDPDAKNKTGQYFRDAMAAPAKQMKNVYAVQTAPYWDQKLAAIDDKHQKIRQMGYLLRVKNKNSPNADGHMSPAEQKAYLKKYEADLISPQETALWNRAASNAGYHYLGSGKTLAQIGRAFAEALITKN